MDGTAVGREVAAANQAAQMSEWYHPMHLDDIAVVEHQRGTRGKFCCCLADFSARPYWSGRHLAPSLCFTHTHMRKNCSPDVLAHAMICGRCWGLSIYFIKASYYTPMACGELCTCGLVPKQRRIKCRTWHWNRNLTAVSSGNLDLDLNSNKVFFFFLHSISQIQARTLHSVFLRSYFIEYHFR